MYRRFVMQTFSDETSSYCYSLDRDYNVKEFIEETLIQFPKEDGTLSIEDKLNSNYKVLRYNNGELKNEIPIELENKKVIKVLGCGGYGTVKIVIIV